MINVKVEPLAPAHVEEIPRAFAAVRWPGKNASLYPRYLAEQNSGTRSVLVASADAQVLDSAFMPTAAAHLMYLNRGYVPDGRGVVYQFAPVAPGTTVRVDDDLNLMMTRVL